jgi:uncharacterized membrane protein YphA (DoxX/SURF4 family)
MPSIDYLGALQQALTLPVVRWIALLGLTAAYVQGGIAKLLDFPVAIAEMRSHRLAPAAPLAGAVIALELAGSALVLCGFHRWLGALVLGGFTFVANFLGNRFWQASPAERTRVANAFFEHLGLAGGFLLVAWLDLTGRP